MTTRDPSFGIPGRPRRTYPRGKGLEYEGETYFELSPGAEFPDSALEEAIAAVLDAGPYRSGDFLELPMVLYLVRDEGTADVFRVAAYDGTVKLYVLPETESAGLRRFYERLREHTGCEWRVECHSDFEGRADGEHGSGGETATDDATGE